MEEQLFAKPAASPAATPLPAVNAQVTGVATRLKLAEERYANLVKRNQITEESLLAFERDIKAELRVLTKQLVEVRKHLGEMNTKIDAMTGELSSVVQKHEFSTVERYLDMWQPMMFISREEAKRLIEDARQELLAAQQESNVKMGEKRA